MAQGKPQLKFERNPCIKFRQLRHGRTDKFRFHELIRFHCPSVSAKSRTYTLFHPRGVEIELILALRAAVSKIRVDFQNCHIWA